MHLIINGVESGVGRRSLKTKGGKGPVDDFVPLTRSQLQPIYVLEQSHGPRGPILYPSSHPLGWLMKISSWRSAFRNVVAMTAECMFMFRCRQ
jgi:hypothetical protein